MASDDLIIQSMVTGEYITFKAYLTDMGQSFSSTWNTEEVFGRNDPIANFQGTKRTISLTFDVPAADESQAANNLMKCGNLATFLYPGYNIDKVDVIEDLAGEGQSLLVGPGEKSKTFSRPPLVKIEFSNIIKSMNGGGLMGFIESYNFAPTMEAGMFGDGPYYPRNINVSLSFTALHQSDLGWTAEKKKGKKKKKKKDKKENKKEETLVHKWAAKQIPFK